MDTFIMLFDWMSGMPLDERVVYALVYQVTVRGNGWWGTIGSMAQRLGITKASCRAALEHLQQIGAIHKTRQTIMRQERNVYTADLNFANFLRQK